MSAWGNWVNVLQELSEVGTELAVEGKLNTRFYEKAGQKKFISEVEINDLIKNGDVIAFVSSRNDLDFQHVGFVHFKNNKKYILHASQEKKIVCISDVTIDQYIFKNKKITGFQIYRPKI